MLTLFIITVVQRIRRDKQERAYTYINWSKEIEEKRKVAKGVTVKVGFNTWTVKTLLTTRMERSRTARANTHELEQTLRNRWKRKVTRKVTVRVVFCPFIANSISKQ